MNKIYAHLFVITYYFVFFGTFSWFLSVILRGEINILVSGQWKIIISQILLFAISINLVWKNFNIYLGKMFFYYAIIIFLIRHLYF